MAETGRGSTIALWLRREGPSWFGVAENGRRLVATSVAATRDEAARVLAGCLPPGAPSRLAEGPSDYADAMARMLADIEDGDERRMRFELDPEYLPEPASSVYRLAAAIPLGYASSYGRLAAAAGTAARVVGNLMSGNPLYPLVPCHRVVGSDYSLVGYRGRTSGPELDAKLERLRAEARGFREELRLEAAGGLEVFPVERVLEKAAPGGAGGAGQLDLW